jgi:hypothetical protein
MQACCTYVITKSYVITHPLLLPYLLSSLLQFGNPASPTNTQYTLQSQFNQDGFNAHSFNINNTMVTHRLRWAGTNDVTDITLETYDAAGTLLKSFTPQGRSVSWTQTYLVNH